MSKITISQLINDRNNPAANQFVISTEDGYLFQSYDSMICFKDTRNGKIYLTKEWDYSQTTRKHFYIFLRDYCNACGELRKKDIEYEINQGNYIMVDKIELEQDSIKISKIS